MNVVDILRNLSKSEWTWQWIKINKLNKYPHENANLVLKCVGNQHKPDANFYLHYNLIRTGSAAQEDNFVAAHVGNLHRPSEVEEGMQEDHPN